MAGQKKKTPAKEDTAAEKPVETVEAPTEQAQKPTGRLYTEAEVQAIIQQLLSKQEKKPEDETVVLYYAGVCSPLNEAEMPGYGVIRPGQYLEIPKKEFGGKFMSAAARKFIEKRWLLVISGLNEQERRRWNCDYKLGEVLDVNAFDNLLNKPLGELSALFSALCVEHKEFVARYIFGLADGAARAKTPIDNRISLALVRELNSKSKSEQYPEGMLARVEAIIKDNL